MESLRYKFDIFKYGFTLAEVLITLVIIGVVAAMTIPTVISKIEERDTVTRVQKAYSTVAQAWAKFQTDNGCTGTVEGCFQPDEFYNSNQNGFHNRFLKYFNCVERIGTGKSLGNVDWLPETTYNLSGSEMDSSYYWYGVSKRAGGSGSSAFFTLADGTIFHIHMPDSSRKSGYVFFDTNGKKGPNRIGKDQFPIGIGAYNNPEYEGIVHPFYNEDSEGSFGLCNIRNNGQCSPDTCTQTNCSPTAYVLKHKKLPPINW